MCWEPIIQILQTLGIIGALIISILALSISRKEITSRLRPYVFTHAFYLNNNYSGNPPTSIEKLTGFYLEIVLKNTGSIPGIIKAIKIEEFFSDHPGLPKKRTPSLRISDIVYPESEIVVALPEIKAPSAREIARGNVKYDIKIFLVYTQPGLSKEYYFERGVSYNPKLKAKIQNESIGKIT